MAIIKVVALAMLATQLHAMKLYTSEWQTKALKDDMDAFPSKWSRRGHTMVPKAATRWGDWGTEDECPFGEYAYAFQLKNEPKQGRGDDSAINGVKLFCRKFCDQSGSAEITSAVERWGKWGKVKQCPDNTLLYSASLRSEKPLKLWADDVSVSNLQMECGGDNRQSSKLVGEGHAWGDWLAYSSCASGHYICGIHTLVEKYQGNADDTALNAVRFLCCERPTNPQC